MILVKADARHIPLRDESVQCVVTSPPYWGLRDYGLGDKGIGLERTPEEYVANIVQVFREIWRVLRQDGTVWVNLGDCYHSGDRGGYRNDSHRWENCPMQSKAKGSHLEAVSPNRLPQIGLKDKDLCGIPWRVAFALQAEGWYLRSDIIWAKPNPMPESVRDRPTKAHEYVFLLSKSQRYYYDQEAVREAPFSKGLPTAESLRGKGWHDHTRDLEEGQRFDGKSTHRKAVPENGRNLRSVWTIPTQPFPGAHFATFPEQLAERCIRAGSSERGACPKCGAGWKRTIEREKVPQEVFTKTNNIDPKRQRTMYGGTKGYGGTLQAWRNEHPDKTIGWSPSCSCDAGDPVPCIVLDPFGGSGTVARVAVKLGRRAVHMDLAYHELARTTRCTQIQQVMA